MNLQYCPGPQPVVPTPNVQLWRAGPYAYDQAGLEPGRGFSDRRHDRTTSPPAEVRPLSGGEVEDHAECRSLTVLLKARTPGLSPDQKTPAPSCLRVVRPVSRDSKRRPPAREHQSRRSMRRENKTRHIDFDC